MSSMQSKRRPEQGVEPIEQAEQEVADHLRRAAA